jgi:hypothetical protein
MRAVQISVCTLLSLVFSTMTAHACSCVKYETIQEHADSHDVIFVGESTGTRRNSTGPDRFTLERKTEFIVISMLKGEKSGTIELFHVEDMGGNCGLNFYNGARYLVFAYKDDEGRLETSFCTGTHQLVSKQYDWDISDYALAVGQ